VLLIFSQVLSFYRWRFMAIQHVTSDVTFALPMSLTCDIGHLPFGATIRLSILRIKIIYAISHVTLVVLTSLPVAWRHFFFISVNHFSESQSEFLLWFFIFLMSSRMPRCLVHRRDCRLAPNIPYTREQWDQMADLVLANLETMFPSPPILRHAWEVTWIDRLLLFEHLVEWYSE
jgi:hypothetical protein